LKKRWIIKDCNQTKVERLQSELGISVKLCEVLVKRGIECFDQAKKFFRPDISQLHDPFLMKDMDKAVHRILSAVEQHEKVCVYGDYDVDGTTSVSLLYHYLSHQWFDAAQIFYYIPDRNAEGYGLSYKGIDYAAAQDCTLMILADCGIKDVEKVRYACDKGIDVIILDHHIPEEILPPAYAILDPKQKDCSYPFKELSACGIVYKLVTALHLHHEGQELIPDYIEWTTLSIASDIVPLLDENRVIASIGLQKIQSNPSPIIRLFKERLALGEKPLTISDLVFKIGPKINAAGRMTHAHEVVKLLIEDQLSVQLEQIDVLFKQNEERQSIDKDMTQEIFTYLDQHLKSDQRSIVLFNPQWHKGILGIVASRVVEKYYKPTIVMTESNGVCVGSARSVHGFDLYESISRVRDHVIQFGGHAFAAGLTVEKSQLDGFITAYENSVREHILPTSLIPEIEADAEIQLEDITPTFVKILYQFEPCGPYNQNPIFLIKNLYDTGFSKCVKDVHAQLFLTHNPNSPSSKKIKGIAFNMGEWVEYLKQKNPIDVVCHIEQDVWQGEAYIQLRILDIRASKI